MLCCGRSVLIGKMRLNEYLKSCLMRGSGWRVLGALVIASLPGAVLLASAHRIDNVVALVILAALSILWLALPPATLSFAYNRATA